MCIRNSVLLFLVYCAMTASAIAQSTEFTYQGKLNDGGVAANGSYDLQFQLYDDVAAGAQIGPTVTVPAVIVVQGIFTVRIDFGNRFDGSDRYVQISVRPAGSQAGFQQLLPRQRVASSPYAIQAISASVATLALDSSRLGGVEAAQYVLTGDPRMSDPRDPTAGSGNYIQNRAGPQTADFNITGNGTVGSTFAANVVNSLTQFNINGLRAFGYGNLSSLFAGQNAGAANAIGDGNTFVGFQSGMANTDGSLNSFVGSSSGLGNTIGERNAFFGNGAGRRNTSGSSNTFIGERSGFSNTTGSNNTLIGQGTSVGASDLNFATAIGAGAFVDTSNTIVLGRILDQVIAPNTLRVFGELQANGSLLTNLNAANVTTGVLPAEFGGTGIAIPGGPGNYLRSNGVGWASSRIQLLDLPDLGGMYIRSSTIQQALANFNISGDGTVGGTLSGDSVNATTEFRFGGLRALSFAGTSNTFVGIDNGSRNSSGLQNTFVGAFSGNLNTTGSFNSFFGVAAGSANVDGNRNSFFGNGAGQVNTASFNSFFGNAAGNANIDGSENSFYGNRSGLVNTSGSRNAFFGAEAGIGNTQGYGNSFFGYGSGSSSTTGFENTFVGSNAGSQNRTGRGNSFLGFDSGANSEAAMQNTLLGYKADSKGLFTPIENGTALGAFARVERDNSIVLGAVNGVNGANFDTNVGIGTTKPLNRLHVVGGTSLIGNLGIGTTSPSAPVDVSVNGGRVQIGSGGCGNGFAGLGFAPNFDACANYSMLGDGTDTIINRSSGGTLYFRQNNFTEMRLDGSGNLTVEGSVFANRNMSLSGLLTVGYISLTNLGPGGSTQICRSPNNVLAVCSSSLRYKKDLVDYQGGLDIVTRLRPLTFRWRADDSPDLGFGAEEVAAVDPQLVTYNEKGEVEGVKYDRLSTVFVNAFKEQQAQIQSQQKQIESQQKQIDRQQQQIELLKTLLCQMNAKAEVCREEK